jgi:hypothetical protein
MTAREPIHLIINADDYGFSLVSAVEFDDLNKQNQY